MKSGEGIPASPSVLAGSAGWAKPVRFLENYLLPQQEQVNPRDLSA